MSTVPMTKNGADLLKEELQRLKSKERPAVINAIAEARAQGDLSENADYDAAKERQSFIEGRMNWKGSCRRRRSLIPPRWTRRGVSSSLRRSISKTWSRVRK
jgi:transcription elongation GreA/GreB family factor